MNIWIFLLKQLNFLNLETGSDYGATSRPRIDDRWHGGDTSSDGLCRSYGCWSWTLQVGFGKKTNTSNRIGPLVSHEGHHEILCYYNVEQNMRLGLTRNNVLGTNQ